MCVTGHREVHDDLNECALTQLQTFKSQLP